MHVEFNETKKGKPKEIVITLPIEVRESASGKMILIAGTRGWKDSDIEFKGETVRISVNAGIKNS